MMNYTSYPWYTMAAAVTIALSAPFPGTSPSRWLVAATTIDTSNCELIANLGPDNLDRVTTVTLVGTSAVCTTYGPVEDPPVPALDLATTAATLGFTTLVTALEAANMLVLGMNPPNPGPITVFACSNDAFAKLGDELLGCLVKPENVLVLQEIFSYHYTYGQVLAGELTNGQMITMANGKDININILDGGVVINENSAVVMSNVLANNGVIHAIDNVLIPPGLDVAGFLAECVATDPPVPEPNPTARPTSRPIPNKSSKSSKSRRRN